MIVYDNLWNTMKQKGITQYALTKKYGISPGQITRLKRNESVSTHTIEMARDAIGLAGISMEDNNQELPIPSEQSAARRTARNPLPLHPEQRIYFITL